MILSLASSNDDIYNDFGTFIIKNVCEVPFFLKILNDLKSKGNNRKIRMIYFSLVPLDFKTFRIFMIEVDTAPPASFFSKNAMKIMKLMEQYLLHHYKVELLYLIKSQYMSLYQVEK